MDRDLLEQTIRQVMSGEYRLDANETAVLVQQLEHMLAREQQTKYAPLRALSFFPVSEEIEAGSQTWSYEVWDEVAMAKIISNYADDLPMVDVEARKVTGQVQTIGIGYQYSRQDLRRAAKSGRPLPDRKRRAAMRGMDRKIDDIASVGDLPAGLQGILDHPNITVLNAASPASGSDTTWNGGDKTVAEVLADLNDGASKAWIDTLTNWQADTLLLPPERLTYLEQTPWSTDNSDSILTVFMRNSRFIRNVDSWTKLSTAGANGGPAALFYARDPETVQFHMPKRPEFYEPQQRNLSFVIPGDAEVAGMAVYEPLTVVRMDLI